MQALAWGRFTNVGRSQLEGVSRFVPSWPALTAGLRPPSRELEFIEPGGPRAGWQHEAASRVEAVPNNVGFTTAFTVTKGHVEVPELTSGRSCLLCRLALPLPLTCAVAGVAVLSTLLATTGQRAQSQECWVGEGLPWRVQLHGCAERQARELPQISS